MIKEINKFKKIQKKYNSDLDKFNNYLYSQGFNNEQFLMITDGIRRNLDVEVYAKKEFNARQMGVIMTGLLNKYDVKLYAKPEYDVILMNKIFHILNDTAAKKDFNAEFSTYEEKLNKINLLIIES